MQLAQHTPELAQYLGRQAWLRLVPFEFDDLEKLYTWLNNPRVFRFQRGEPLSRLIDLPRYRDITTHNLEQRVRMWALRLSDNTLVGSMDVLLHTKGKDVSWGHSIIGPDHLAGAGFGSVAKGLVLKHLFTTVGAHSVTTWVHRDNTASQRFNRAQGAVVHEERDALQTLRFTREAWAQRTNR